MNRHIKSFPGLDAEWLQLRKRLSGIKPPIQAVWFEEGKTGHLHLSVVTEKNNRALEIKSKTPVVAHLNESEQALCGEAVAELLKGLHLACKTGYFRESRIEYYVKPDWKYFYGLLRETK